MLLQQSGGTNDQVPQAMMQSALDIDSPGFDPASGAGLVQITPFTPSGGGGGGGGGGRASDDAFESNDTSERAANLGIMVPGSVTLGSLTLINHVNGLPDYDWYRATAATTGVFTVSMNYNSTGDLHMRLYTVDANNTLVPLGLSTATGLSKQIITALIPQGMPILIWVYGFNFAQGAYDLTLSMT